ncbi:MAG: class I SAM-dependent methyltransferase, partial [Thermoleophilia bacterium]
GRVAIPLARDGHEVWALDASLEMLAELGQRLAAEPAEVAGRVRPVGGDIAGFALPARFRLVLVAMNTLQVLTEPEDRRSCLASVREHLAPGGELVFDVALPDPDEIAGSLGVERPGGVHRDRESGETLRHTAWYDTWDPGTHTLEFTTRIQGSGGDAPQEVLRHHRVHLFTPEEIRELVAGAGLEHVSVHGDFGGGPLRPWGERQVHRCRRPA